MALSTAKLPEGDKVKRMADLTECLRTYYALQLWRDAEFGVMQKMCSAAISCANLSRCLMQWLSLCFVNQLVTLITSRPSFPARFTLHTPYLSHKHHSQYTKTRPPPTSRGPPTNLSRHLRHARIPSTLHSQRRLALLRQPTRSLFCTTAYSRSWNAM